MNPFRFSSYVALFSVEELWRQEACFGFDVSDISGFLLREAALTICFKWQRSYLRRISDYPLVKSEVLVIWHYSLNTKHFYLHFRWWAWVYHRLRCFDLSPLARIIIYSEQFLHYYAWRLWRIGCFKKTICVVSECLLFVWHDEKPFCLVARSDKNELKSNSWAVGYSGVYLDEV